MSCISVCYGVDYYALHRILLYVYCTVSYCIVPYNMILYTVLRYECTALHCTVTVSLHTILYTLYHTAPTSLTVSLNRLSIVDTRPSATTRRPAGPDRITLRGERVCVRERKR
jgi:hypothetical protein